MDDATTGRTVKKLTDPRALRALAHPLRLSLVGLLRRDGPLTATRAAALLGESSGLCSFHLRQLAKYGLVEEAGGGRGRERPWRATTMFTGWPEVAGTPEFAAADSVLREMLASRYFEQLMRWLEARQSEPAAWQEAAHFGDTLLWVTSDELLELAREEQALLDRYLERLTRPELRPAGARMVTYLHLAFPGDLSGAPVAPQERGPVEGAHERRRAEGAQERGPAEVTQPPGTPGKRQGPRS